MSYTFLQVTQHIYDRNKHSRLLSQSHRHMRSHTHSICSRHALQQVLIFSSIYRLRIAGNYALLMFVTCFDLIPTAGTTLDRVSTVRPSSSAYAQRTTIVKVYARSAYSLTTTGEALMDRTLLNRLLSLKTFERHHIHLTTTLHALAN